MFNLFKREPLPKEETPLDWVGGIFVGVLIHEVREWCEPIPGTSYWSYRKSPVKADPLSGEILEATLKSIRIKDVWYVLGSGAGEISMTEVYHAKQREKVLGDGQGPVEIKSGSE